MYEYRAKKIKVQDGDTIKLDVDLGFNAHIHSWIRLAHVDAPELKEAKGAEALRRFDELTEGELVIKTTKDRTEKYGRMLAVIHNAAGINVGEQMIDEGLARPYEGGRR